jgi:M6 family metalloprotease-like protein
MKKILFSLMLTMLTMSMMAVPAKKGLWKMLPTDNGSQVRAMLVGDEFGHYWKGADGRRYAVVDGRFKELSAPAIDAGVQRRALAQKRRADRLKLASRTPDGRKIAQKRAPNPAHFGPKKGLILLVNFSDVKFQKDHDPELYNNIANTPGYTDDNGFVGSVADYFRDQSRKQFELTFDVVGPVTVSKNAEYYGENDKNGDDKHAEEMVVEAINLAKEFVADWKQYDWDGDDEVDQVMIIYAGEGEADGGSENTIWPHEWELQYVNLDFEVADGIKVNTYAVANEGYVQQDWAGKNSFHINGIGTICHEFSHCLGLMDMYDVGYSGNYGMGVWSIMDQGSYLGDGFIPSGYTSFDKYSIGWLDPVELTTATEVNDMQALTDANEAYIIKNAAHPDEYYLLENRQQNGWDAKTPAKGMLVLHVDYDPDIWYFNLINSNSDGSDDYPVNDHQRCTIFHADGVDKTGETYEKIVEIVNQMENASGSAYDRLADQYNDLWDQYDADVWGDVYPQANNNQLTNTSMPRAFLYNKNDDGRKLMNIAITDIKQNNSGTISFKFAPDNSGTEEGDNTVYGNSTTTKPDLEGALFYESFDLCDGKGGNDGQWSGLIATGQFNTDQEGWVAEKGYGANQCAKFGTSSVSGSATTPEFTMNGTGVLTFKAGAWNAKNDGTTLNISVSNGTVDVASVEMEKGCFNDYEATITATGNVKITFEAEKGRFFLDEVIVKDLTATAIRTVDSTTDFHKSTRIFTLDGRYVGNDYRTLGRGIYIVGGKKLVVR